MSLATIPSKILPRRTSALAGKQPAHLARAVGIACIVTAFVISIYGVATADYYLCLESIFLGFIPYILVTAYLRTGSLDIFAPDVGFPLAYILYLFIGSINLPIETQFGLTLPWTIWIYYILGLVAYLLGVRTIRAPRPALTVRNRQKRFWRTDRFLTITTGLFIVGMAARLLVVAKTGIPILHAADESARVAGVGGVLGALALCMEAAFECFLIYLFIIKAKGMLRILMMSAMLFVLLNSLGSGNRTALLRIVFAAFVVAHYTIKRFGFVPVLVFGVFVTVFASALGTFRDVSEWGDSHVQSLEQQGFTNKTYWIFSGYQAVRLPTETFYMTIQQFPAIDGYTYGSTSLASLFEVLPGHRPGPSEIVKNKLRLNFVGFGAAATILTPLWFDGGVVGILIGMFIIGIVSQALYRRMIRSPNPLWVLVYAWYVQNAFKAIKDDILPELGFTFVIFMFFVVDAYSGLEDLAPIRAAGVASSARDDAPVMKVLPAR